MGLGPTEIIVIVLVALLVFGPGRIAGVGRGLGEGIKNFKEGLRVLPEPDEGGIAAEPEAADNPTPQASGADRSASPSRTRRL